MEAALNLQLISTIVGIFMGLGALIAGVGFAYSQFKTGGDKAKNDLIDTLKEQAIAEREKASRLAEEKVTLVDSHQTQINQLNERIGKLQGLYEASEQSRQEYLKILQGRDPAQQKFIENQSKFMEVVMKQIEENQKTAPEAARYMAETGKILVEIRNFMETLNKSANKNTEFLNDVNKATESEEGKVLRKK